MDKVQIPGLIDRVPYLRYFFEINQTPPEEIRKVVFSRNHISLRPDYKKSDMDSAQYFSKDMIKDFSRLEPETKARILTSNARGHQGHISTSVYCDKACTKFNGGLIGLERRLIRCGETDSDSMNFAVLDVMAIFYSFYHKTRIRAIFLGKDYCVGVDGVFKFGATVHINPFYILNDFYRGINSDSPKVWDGESSSHFVEEFQRFMLEKNKQLKMI